MSATPDYPDSVVDERGNVYELSEEPIGRGGQGVVFRSTSTPDIAVKFCAPLELPDVTREPARQKLRRRLEEVRILPLDGLPVASPLAMLRGHVGYSMRLLDDMEPIGALIATAGQEQLAAFYLETGGLRRRLSLLGSAAETLAQLHGRPLVYGDISHNNVFIPDYTDGDVAWLIDCDNLHWLPQQLGGVYTPYFGAPEVVQHGASADTLTDIYSFSILAYWVLTQRHPFLGAAVDNDGWELSTSEDMEAKALRGELAFVDDPDDPENRAIDGIPSEIVLTSPLRRLFERVLARGRTDRTERPNSAEFALALRRAADVTIKCGDCEMTHYVNVSECPWCSTSAGTGVLSVEMRHWEPQLDEDDWSALRSAKPLWRTIVQHGESGALRTQAVVATPLSQGNKRELEISVSKNGVHLKSIGERAFTIVSGPAGSSATLIDEKTLPLPTAGREWFIHCGPPDESHRIACARYFERKAGA